MRPLIIFLPLLFANFVWLRARQFIRAQGGTTTWGGGLGYLRDYGLLYGLTRTGTTDEVRRQARLYLTALILFPVLSVMGLCLTSTNPVVNAPLAPTRPPAETQPASTAAPTATHRPTPTRAPEMLLPLCDREWRAEARTWLDDDADGTWDEAEPPLPDVPVFIDESPLTHAAPAGPNAISDENGSASLYIWLPGCPKVSLTVYVAVPAGYHLTTRETLPGHSDRPGEVFAFGFAAD